MVLPERGGNGAQVILLLINPQLLVNPHLDFVRSHCFEGKNHSLGKLHVWLVDHVLGQRLPYRAGVVFDFQAKVPCTIVRIFAFDVEQQVLLDLLRLHGVLPLELQENADDFVENEAWIAHFTLFNSHFLDDLPKTVMVL